MSAFLICDVKVKDRDKLLQYLSLSEHTLAPFGGKFHVQAGKIEVIEGDWNPQVIIIAEFPSMEKAKEWYSSAEYAKALKVKPDAIERNMIITDGLN
ncbi:MAG: DUF1330 domain-containing protein [Acidiferrobacterales bacterium]|nr:DUF1330 domain-containing protein [Acidiferrobacterales bacterium]